MRVCSEAQAVTHPLAPHCLSIQVLLPDDEPVEDEPVEPVLAPAVAVLSAAGLLAALSDEDDSFLLLLSPLAPSLPGDVVADDLLRLSVM